MINHGSVRNGSRDRPIPFAGFRLTIGWHDKQTLNLHDGFAAQGPTMVRDGLFFFLSLCLHAIVENMRKTPQS